MLNRRTLVLLAACLTAGALGFGPASASPRRAAGLALERPGITDVYIISAGLFGSQSVFESEAKGAARILERQLSRPGHSIILSNTKKRTAATQESLAAAASAVAAVADPKEDVVVVALTSHGSHAGVAITKGREIDILPPAEIAKLLDSTGMRYRVLIVSACYSGIFAQQLADDRTLVITAASADRPSFGCQDGATWTYFGDAFYNRALRTEPVLWKAFDKARAFVTQRERAEGFDPSNPQIAGGSLVLEMLYDH